MLIAPPRRPKDKNQTKGTVRQTRVVVVGDVACVVAVTTTLVGALELLEVSPKFNCCKMEYLLILRFKGPLRFSMFRTRLSRKLAWPCVFLNGLRDFSCRAPFWRPCTFACVPARLFQSVFVAPLQHGHSSRGGSACMFLRMDGQCF